MRTKKTTRHVAPGTISPKRRWVGPPPADHDCPDFLSLRHRKYDVEVEDIEGPEDFAQFYILWNPAAIMPPKKRFESFTDAEEVAKLMAAKHKGQFFVLKALSCTQPIPALPVVTTYPRPRPARRTPRRK